MIAARSMIEAAFRRLRSLPQQACTFRCLPAARGRPIRDLHFASFIDATIAHAVQRSLSSANAERWLFRVIAVPHSQQPKAFSFHCRELKSASFDADHRSRRLQSASFVADLPPPPGHPPSIRIFQCVHSRALVSPASVYIFRRTVHRATSVPESICISRRSRSIGTSVLTLAHVFARIAHRPRPCSSFDAHVHDRCAVHTSTHVSRSRLTALPNTLTARVHIQRIVIEKVWLFPLGWNHPARAFEPSDQSFASTELLPYPREHSSTRLAALPNQ